MLLKSKITFHILLSIYDQGANNGTKRGANCQLKFSFVKRLIPGCKIQLKCNLYEALIHKDFKCSKSHFGGLCHLNFKMSSFKTADAAAIDRLYNLVLSLSLSSSFDSSVGRAEDCS